MKNTIPLGVILIAALAFILPASAATARDRTPHQHPRQPAVHDRTPVVHPHLVERGLSTWYGPEMRIKRLSGKNGNVYHKMANGEVFDPAKFTAASRTLPLGTMVRVLNLKTGLEVDVEITDRGPYAKGRILDLAQAAAYRIQCLGVCPVLIRPTPTVEPETAAEVSNLELHNEDRRP